MWEPVHVVGQPQPLNSQPREGMLTDVAGGAGDQDTLLGKVNGRTTMSRREGHTLREGFSVEGIW